MIWTFAIALLWALCFTTEVGAWNALGHKVVAELAWRQTTPEQRQAIVDTIRRHPTFDRDFVAKMDDDVARGDKAIQDHWVFLQAAAWPDIIRDDKERDRPEWHYIDFPIYFDKTELASLARNVPNTATDYRPVRGGSD